MEVSDGFHLANAGPVMLPRALFAVKSWLGERHTRGRRDTGEVRRAKAQITVFWNLVQKN